MKATGIVRRVEARVIITQKSLKSAQALDFSLVFVGSNLHKIRSKSVFGDFKKEQNTF